MNNVRALRPEEPEQPATTSANRHDQVRVMISANNRHGMTWREVAQATGMGHGTVSAVLSTLHQAGTVARLKEKRDGLRVYVLPEWVGDRETESPAKSRQNLLLAQMAETLRRVPTKCQHYYYDANCRSCEIKRLLKIYDDRLYRR